MHSDRPAPDFYSDPKWSIRVFQWLYSGSVWRKIGVVLVLTLLLFIVNVVITLLSKGESWGFWSTTLANGFVPAAAMGFLFYLIITSVSHLIGQRIIAYIPGPDALRKLPPSDLEHLTAEIYRTKGHQVKRRGILGQPDKGIDLEILRHGKRGIIQCKRWTYENVGVDKLRELHGAMVDAKAEFAIFVTTSDFTEPAEQYVADKPIELVNLAALWEMVSEAKLEEEVKKLAQEPLRIEVKNPLQCPQCGNGLVLRKSRHGEFLGCKSYHNTGCSTLVPVKRG